MRRVPKRLESRPVVVSILLALAQGKWAEAREQQRLARQALHRFTREIEASHQRVRQVLP